MKAASLVVCVSFMAVVGGASAQSHDGPSSEKGFRPTPGMMTMMSLGQSGILHSLFSSEIYGNTQTKTGTSRATIGYIEESLKGQNVPEAYWPTFKDRGTTVVVPISVIKELPSGSGANFFRLNFEPNWARGRSSLPVQTKGGTGRIDLQFLHAPIPTRLFGVGLLYEHSDYDVYYNDDPVDTKARSKRGALGLSLNYAEAYTEQWGLASRMEYQKGRADYTVKNQFVRQHHRFDENRWYAQAELIGTLNSTQLSYLPETWLFRPILGINYQKSIFGSAKDSVINKKQENYGAVWARARFEKKQLPGPQWQFIPTFSVGLEREYLNDLDVELKDSTYGLASVGMGIVRGSARLDLEYNLRKGLSSKRRENVISAAVQYYF